MNTLNVVAAQAVITTIKVGIDIALGKFSLQRPAARALADTGAHTAPIMTGSLNVFISNFPAARQGDPITCPSPDGHPPAIISGGSTTVFINGLPAARQFDNTSCGGPHLFPVSGSPVAPIISSAANGANKTPKKNDIDSELEANRKSVVTKGIGHILSKSAATIIKKGTFEDKRELSFVQARIGDADFEGILFKTKVNQYDNEEQKGTDWDINASALTVKTASESVQVDLFNANAHGTYMKHLGGGDNRKVGYEMRFGASADLASAEMTFGNPEETSLTFGLSVGVGAAFDHGVSVDRVTGKYHEELSISIAFFKLGNTYSASPEELKKNAKETADRVMANPTRIRDSEIFSAVRAQSRLDKYTAIVTAIPGVVMTGCPTVLIGG